MSPVKAILIVYGIVAAVDPEAKVLLEELKDFGVSLPAINK